MKGQIIRNISNLYRVKCGSLEFDCQARGIFRKNKVKPMVGDYVIINEGDKLITEILPRHNELLRPVVANVDLAIIVMSVKKPDLDLNLLDKFLTVIIYNNIEPVIYFSKVDLLDERKLEELECLKLYYESIGIKVYQRTDSDRLVGHLKGKIAVLAGQSGAGKSTLVNNLRPDLSLKTQEISEALGRGKHTTRHVELYQVGEGFLVDTPGFSSLSLDNIPKEGVRDSFIEFSNYECKFRDCMHHAEKNCAVKEAISKKEILKSRYDNYRQFLKELER